jgi:hypothetical protein
MKFHQSTTPKQEKEVVNFQELMSDLQGRGWSTGRVAQKLGVNQSTLTMLAKRDGREPRYNLGAQLVDLERRTRPRKKATAQ